MRVEYVWRIYFVMNDNVDNNMNIESKSGKRKAASHLNKLSIDGGQGNNSEGLTRLSTLT